MTTKKFFIWAYLTLLINFIAPNLAFAFTITPSTINTFNAVDPLGLITLQNQTNGVTVGIIGDELGEGDGACTYLDSEYFFSDTSCFSILYDFVGVPIIHFWAIEVTGNGVGSGYTCDVDYYGKLSYQECLDSEWFVSLTFFDVIYTPQLSAGGGGGSIFHFNSPTTNEPSDNPTDLLASVGTVTNDVFGSALPYMLLVIGVGVTFYILQNLKKTVPKENKKSYDIITEKSLDGTYHVSFRDKKQ